MISVEELDDAWSKERRNYMHRSRFGWAIPKNSRGVIYIIVAILFFLLSAFLLFWSFYQPSVASVLTFLGILGIAILYIFFAKTEFRMVPIYREAHEEYLKTRGKLANPAGIKALK